MVGSGVRRTATAAACGAALLLQLLLIGCGPTREGFVVASNNAVAEDSRFINASAASQTYADVAATLLASTKRCVASRTASDPRCAARASAAAFFQVLSVQVVGCDRAGTARSRQAARAALGTIDAADRSGGRKPPPQPPAMPRC
jgi:hypothetical protein